MCCAQLLFNLNETVILSLAREMGALVGTRPDGSVPSLFRVCCIQWVDTCFMLPLHLSMSLTTSLKTSIGAQLTLDG